MSAPLGKSLTTVCVLAISLFALSGCAVDADTTSVTAEATSTSTDANRLTAAATASPDLQVFLDTWDKDGVTIAETPATDDSQLIAFTDDNGNAVPDEGEPVLSSVEGEISDIPELALSLGNSNEVTGRCGSNSYVVRPGNYDYRGKTFAVSMNRAAYQGGFGGSCTLTLYLSSEPFPGEEWNGLIFGTKSGQSFGEYSVVYWSTKAVQIDIPFPTAQEMFEDVYGRDGELSIFSQSKTNETQGVPEERMIVGSWKSEVTFSN